MPDRIISIQEHIELGTIKLVDPDTRFPWEFFIGGEINCAFQMPDAKNMNNIRVWINNNVEEPVYIQRSRWGLHPCKIGFTMPEDAAKFALKFGDAIEKLDD